MRLTVIYLFLLLCKSSLLPLLLDTRNGRNVSVKFGACHLTVNMCVQFLHKYIVCFRKILQKRDRDKL